jgi:hypothetical protein
MTPHKSLIGYAIRWGAFFSPTSAGEYVESNLGDKMQKAIGPSDMRLAELVHRHQIPRSHFATHVRERLDALPIDWGLVESFWGFA